MAAVVIYEETQEATDPGAVGFYYNEAIYLLDNPKDNMPGKSMPHEVERIADEFVLLERRE